MAREVPKHVKKFQLTKVSASAVTYHLRPEGGHGWALATVNDETCELIIQSDWGNWSHRWPVAGMAVGLDGRRCTLTEFLADRDEGHCDYVADKLTSREEREQFDSYASVKRMREVLVEQRVKQARKVIDYYLDEEPADREDVGTDDPKRWGPWESHTVRCRYTYQDEKWFLTKQTVRTLYDKLGELEGCENQDQFLNLFFQVSGYELISDEPWHADVLVFEPSPHYYQLLYGILPAVVRACGEEEMKRRGELAAKVAPVFPEQAAEVSP